MLSRRIATSRPLRNAIPIARRAALNQQRGVAQQVEPNYPKLVSAIPINSNDGALANKVLAD